MSEYFYVTAGCEMSQISVTFLFECNQLNGNSIDFVKINIWTICMGIKLLFGRFMEIDQVVIRKTGVTVVALVNRF